MRRVRQPERHLTATVSSSLPNETQDQPPLGGAQCFISTTQRINLSTSSRLHRLVGLLREFSNILQVLFVGCVDEFPGSCVVAARKRAVYRNHLFQRVGFIEL